MSTHNSTSWFWENNDRIYKFINNGVEVEVNAARLIAAYPDMLSALRKCLKAMAHSHYYEPAVTLQDEAIAAAFAALAWCLPELVGDEAIAAAFAAIEKATGVTP